MLSAVLVSYSVKVNLTFILQINSKAHFIMLHTVCCMNFFCVTTLGLTWSEFLILNKLAVNLISALQLANRKHSSDGN